MNIEPAMTLVQAFWMVVISGLYAVAIIAAMVLIVWLWDVLWEVIAPLRRWIR